MARIRTVKPEFFTSASNARLSRDARLLFIGLFTEVDDEGRSIDSAKRLAGCLFPHEKVSVRLIERWLAELEAEGKIVRYEKDGGRFLQVVNFCTHQRVSHPSPSKFPGPPFPPSSGDPPEHLPKPSRAIRETFAPDLGSGSRNGKGILTQSSSPPTALGPQGCDDDDLEQAKTRAQARLAERSSPDVVSRHGPVGDHEAWLEAATKREMATKAESPSPPTVTVPYHRPFEQNPCSNPDCGRMTTCPDCGSAPIDAQLQELKTIREGLK